MKTESGRRPGKAYIVGAGPGDPGLLTERAVRVLAIADLVLYDALVHRAVLARARPGATLEHVGARHAWGRDRNADASAAERADAGNDARQTRIHTRMIEAARAGQVVVRLKGGDPFLFGRGSEEAEALAAAGVDFEVVPGVPSPTAVAAYAGISLTHRDLAASVVLLTGTERADRSSSAHDWGKLASAAQTLCIFMGMHRLEEVVASLVSHGRDPATPIAIVANGTRPDQHVVEGTLADIAERARTRFRQGSPALLVVGEVVRLRDRIRWFDNRPLFGKRTLVTRAREQSGALSELLRDEGAEPIEIATIRLVPPLDCARLEKAAREAAAYDLVVFTSQNGVRAFFEAVERTDGDTRRLGRATVAAIGPATARALGDRGIRADVVPEEYVAESLVASLRTLGPFAGKSVLLPRAAVARDVVPDALRAEGATVDVVEAYRTVGPEEADVAELRARLDAREIDVVTFTASSTCRNLVEALGADAAGLLAHCFVASIGPVTTETARTLGIRVDATATTFTLEGLVQSLRAELARRESAKG